MWISLKPFSTQGGHASSFDGEGGQDVGIPQSYLLQVGNHAKRLPLGMVISIMNHLTCETTIIIRFEARPS